MITDINSEDRLVQRTFAGYLRDELRWESLYAWQEETFGPNGTLGRGSEREVVLVRDLRAALARLNPDLPESAHEQAVEKLTRVDFSRSLVQHNREFHGYIRRGVPVEWRAAKGATHRELAQVIDFRSPTSDRNRFLAVRELKIQGVRVPHYNRRADLVCFVNGLPLVFIELKAVYKNIRAGFDNNLTDYLDKHSIAHAFHHNALLVVSNGDRARYGSITSRWEHFVEWKRNDEKALGRLDAQVLLDGILAKDRLLDVSREVVRMDVESRSSSVVTELHGDLAFPIPEPGIYFVSLVINESRVATAILPAETPAAEWSYALRPEDTARVEGGELLALLRGSQTEEEAREARGQTSA